MMIRENLPRGCRSKTGNGRGRIAEIERVKKNNLATTTVYTGQKQQVRRQPAREEGSARSWRSTKGQ